MRGLATVLAICAAAWSLVIVPESSAFGPSGGAMGGMMGHGGGAAAPQITGPIKVDRASGKNAYTVEEVYAKGGDLDRKEAVVRAMVVKVSKGIMGKNWVHLRDGSGDEAKRTHKLVATSQDVPAVGDVVTAKGTLYKDKDFGAGYQYEMIMEEATFSK